MSLTGAIPNKNITTKLENIQGNITDFTAILRNSGKPIKVVVIEALEFVSKAIYNLEKQPTLLSEFNISIVNNMDKRFTIPNYIKEHKEQDLQMTQLIISAFGSLANLKGTNELTVSLNRALKHLMEQNIPSLSATESTSRTLPNQLTSKQKQEFENIIENIKAFPIILNDYANIVLDSNNTNNLNIYIVKVSTKISYLATEFDNLLKQANGQHKADFIKDIINHPALTDLKKANYLADNKKHILRYIGYLYEIIKIIEQLRAERQIEAISEIIQSTAYALRCLDNILINEQNIIPIENKHINYNQNNLFADNTTASAACNAIEDSPSSSLAARIVHETQPNTLTATEIKTLNYISNNFRIFAGNFEVVGQNLKALGQETLLFSLDGINMFQEAVNNMRLLSELLDLLSKDQQKLNNPAVTTIKNIISNSLSTELQNPEYFNTKKDEILNYLFYMKRSIELFKQLKITATASSDQKKYDISQLVQFITSDLHSLRIRLINAGYVYLEDESTLTGASNKTANPKQPVVDVSETTADSAEAKDASVIDNLPSSSLATEIAPETQTDTLTATEIKKLNYISDNFRIFAKNLNEIVNQNLKDTQQEFLLFNIGGNVLEKIVNDMQLLAKILDSLSKYQRQLNNPCIQTIKKIISNNLFATLQDPKYFNTKKDETLNYLFYIKCSIELFKQLEIIAYSNQREYDIPELAEFIANDLYALRMKLINTKHIYLENEITLTGAFNKTANPKQPVVDVSETTAADSTKAKDASSTTASLPIEAASLEQDNSDKQSITKSKGKHKKKTQAISNETGANKPQLVVDVNKTTAADSTKAKDASSTTASLPTEAASLEQDNSDKQSTTKSKRKHKKKTQAISNETGANNLKQAENSVEPLLSNLTLQLEKTPLADKLLNLPTTSDLNSKVRQITQGKTIEINSIVDMLAKFSPIENYFHTIDKVHEIITQTRITASSLTKIKPEITNKLKQVIQKDQAVYKDIKLQLQALSNLCNLLTTEKNSNKYKVDQKIIDGCATIKHYFSETDKRTKAIRLNKFIAEILAFLQKSS